MRDGSHSAEKPAPFATGDRGFESGFLQRRSAANLASSIRAENFAERAAGPIAPFSLVSDRRPTIPRASLAAPGGFECVYG
jgi:hypothetical protein